MKYLVQLFIFAALFLSCKNTENNIYEPTTTIIEGIITSLSADEVTLLGIDEYATAIAQDGKFKFDIQLTKSGVYQLKCGQRAIDIYVIPGDSINLAADGRTLPQGAIFKGSNINENNYLRHFDQFKMDTEPRDYEQFYTQVEDEFMKSVEEISQNFIKDAQEYQKTNGTFDDRFVEIVNANFSYQAALRKLQYPLYYNYFKPDSTIVLSDTFDSFFQNLDIDNEDNLLVPGFRSFIDDYVSFKASQEGKKVTTLESSNASFDQIEALFTNKKLRDLTSFNLMNAVLESSYNDAMELMPRFKSIQSSQIYSYEVENKFNQVAHLVKGKEAPGFTYQSFNNQEVSLASLKGNVVYIDVWATWCGPCLQELPFLDELQKRFSAKDKIVFVSVSIDNEKAPWAAAVKQKDLKGIQLFADGNWGSTIARDYKIRGIPRFIILAKDGTILDANAIRPSDERLFDILAAELAKPLNR